MFSSISLKQAPDGYMPTCNTHHHETENTMYQTFPGGRVVFKFNKTTGIADAFVDNRHVGTWDDLTIRTWSDVLYTLETEFKNYIDERL